MQDLTGQSTGTTITAVEWNEFPAEVQNVIEGLGQVLSSGDLNQLGKAIAGYVANGSFYTDAGAAGAYVVSTVGLKQATTAYTDGMRVAFVADNTNTGASTVNVAGLGVKNIFRAGAAVIAGNVASGEVTELIFDLANDRFNQILSRFPYDGNASVYYSGEYATLQAAVAAIGSNVRTLVVHTALAATASVTVPSTLTLQFVGSGVINRSSGFVVTQNSAPSGDIEREIYTGLGTCNGSFGGFPINVLWFGAIGTGLDGDATANSAAFNEAFAVSNTSAIGSIVMVNYRSVCGVNVPHGWYKVDSEITGGTYTKLISDGGAILEAVTDTFTILGGVGYKSYIEGIQFIRGQKGIGIATANANTSAIDIVRCRFHNQTVAQIESDTNSFSTIITLTTCTFLLDSTHTAAIAWNFQTGDLVVANECWVSTASVVSVYMGAIGSVLTVNGGAFIPQVASTTNVWIENHGSLNLQGTQFRAESGGYTVFANYTALDTTPPANGTFIIMENCWSYAANGSFIGEFYEIPNIVRIKNNVGFIGNRGCYLDSAISTNTRDAVGKYCFWDVDQNFFGAANSITGESQLQTKLLYANKVFRGGHDLQESEVLRSAVIDGGGYGIAITGTGTSRVFATNSRGMRICTATGTSVTDEGTLTFTFATMLSFAPALSAGWYTVTCPVDVLTDHSVTISLSAGDSAFAQPIQITKGEQMLAVPFYYDGVGPTSAAISSTQVELGAQYTFGEVRILEGIHENLGERLVAYGSAAPTTTGNWYIGDTVFVETPVLGGPLGWICVAVGTPGTWQEFGVVGASVSGKGADIASAAAIALIGNYAMYVVTGTTSVTSLTASWAGREVTLVFAAALTFTDGSNLKLAGNFVTTADDTIRLQCDGTNWFEISRSVN